MVKVSLLLLLVLISTNSISQVRNKKFEIIGQVSGFDDGTNIGLYDFSTEENVFMDSTRIVNGRFSFSVLLIKSTNQSG